ncbi:MAG: hypothetical protein QM734_09325 [Cyclobacteriaceae bacterium]
MIKIIVIITFGVLLSTQLLAQVRLIDNKKDSTLIHRLIDPNETLSKNVHFGDHIFYSEDSSDFRLQTSTQFIAQLVKDKEQSWRDYKKFIRDLHSWNRIPENPNPEWKLTDREINLYRRKTNYYLWPVRYEFFGTLHKREKDGE